MLHLTPHTPFMRDQGGGDEDNLLSRYPTVAALAERKIEELFVFWSLVAA